MMHQGGMAAVPGTTRYILDDVNHDDFAAPGEIPEAPLTGFVYARGDRGWHRALALSGGQMDGFLVTVNGTPSAPGLMLGSNDTGFYRSGQSVWLNVAGVPNVMGFLPTTIAAAVPLHMGNRQINVVADPTAAQDALNLRSADARYAPRPGAWADFPSDPGYTLLTLRYRTVPGGLQLSGEVGAPLPAQARARMGVLPDGVRPARMQRFPATVTVGLNVGMAAAEVLPDGSVWHQWTIGDSQIVGLLSMNVVIPLD
jgi:hypothetical protein